MWEAMDSSTNPVEIYVQLLREGTPVFRPTRAIPLGKGRYRVLATENYDPEDELWEFPPGNIVCGQLKRLDGDTVLVAVSPDTH